MDLIAFLNDLSMALFTDILSTAIAIPLATYLIVKFFQNFRAARIWGVRTKLRQVFESRPYPTLVMSTSDVYTTETGYRRPMTGIGQVRAMARFGKSLGAAYRATIDDTRVVFSDEYQITRDEFTDDLVVIGGPKTNSIGNALLNGGHLPGVLPDDFAFAPGEFTAADGTIGRAFTLRAGGTQWQPVSDDEVIGMVLRCRNPLSSGDRNLTYVAGLGTYGTEVAARALIECRSLHDPLPFSLRWFSDKTRRRGHRGYLAIVSAKLSGDGNTRRVGSPTVRHLTAVPWTEGSRRH